MNTYEKQIDNDGSDIAQIIGMAVLITYRSLCSYYIFRQKNLIIGQQHSGSILGRIVSR